MGAVARTVAMAAPGAMWFIAVIVTQIVAMQDVVMPGAATVMCAAAIVPNLAFHERKSPVSCTGLFRSSAV